MVAELRERYRPGCDRSLEQVAGRFAERWQVGESVYLARERNYLKR